MNKQQEALRLALEALEYPLTTSSEMFDADKSELLSYRAITAIKQAQKNSWKLMPREATPEMLKAMDECSTEGYDERLLAGHASSVYMAAWDAFDSEREQK